MPVTDMLGLVGHDFDAYSTIGETDDGDCAGFMNDSLCALGVGEAVGVGGGGVELCGWRVGVDLSLF